MGWGEFNDKVLINKCLAQHLASNRASIHVGEGGVGRHLDYW